jgi:hypothetical protein
MCASKRTITHVSIDEEVMYDDDDDDVQFILIHIMSLKQAIAKQSIDERDLIMLRQLSSPS